MLCVKTGGDDSFGVILTKIIFCGKREFLEIIDSLDITGADS